MSYQRTQRVFQCISGLWVGSFITIGLLVVPLLFSSLGDRQVAGFVAASLFKTQAYLGVFLSTFLMVMANYLVRQGLNRFRVIRWILLGMLACAVAAAFILIPWMNSLRDQALYLGISVRESSNAILFSRLHGVSSTIYLIEALLGLALIWKASAIKNAD
ncbi:DUF4149 domain-containing protein [Polynucleobacter sp. MWH-Creno-3A4]|uniref:DUF4149 domain-containing protein n=1 Tax=Polynucleobacter sp. MWH-Creno-3A4 TaxID=1855886 RepID=UPI001C0AB190|nr:DUF4149 domain-containing protein [Polynucleobacter sp. MWH-Creno-3A4]MBU3606662.1 DUF4149 domain-containing protein [Polynucleobacter sp. MWH-Creno-3A4]